MSRLRSSLLPLAAALLLAPGCAHVAPQASLETVSAMAANRGAPGLQWQRESGQSHEARQTVETLLAQVLSVESVVEIALLNNQELQAQLEELGIAQAEWVEVARFDNPVVVGAARFSDNSGTNLDLGITQNLIQLLARPARKRLASAQLEEVELRVADEVLRHAMEAQVRFFEVLGAKQVRQMRFLVAEAAKSSYQLAQRIHAAGNASDLDLASEQSLFEQARVELAHAELALREARENLNLALGLWGADTAWSVPESLPALPATEPPLDRLESVAIAQRLDLAAAVQSVEVAATALGITRDWRYFLTAEIGVSAERETDGEWLIGPELSLELPIFNQRQGEIGVAEGRLRQRAARMASLAVEIRSEVRGLRDRLLMTRDLVEHYRTVVVPLRERIVALTEEQYNYMLKGAFELLMAKQSEYDAYRDYLEAVRDYWVTRVELQHAAGGSLAPASMLAPMAETGPQPLQPVEPKPADDHTHHHGAKR